MIGNRREQESSLGTQPKWFNSHVTFHEGCYLMGIPTNKNDR